MGPEGNYIVMDRTLDTEKLVFEYKWDTRDELRPVPSRTEIARGENARAQLPPPEERAGRECGICVSEARVAVGTIIGARVRSRGLGCGWG